MQILSLMKHPLSWPEYLRPFLVRKKVGKRMRQTVKPLILQAFPICLYYTIRAFRGQPTAGHGLQPERDRRMAGAWGCEVNQHLYPRRGRREKPYGGQAW